MLISDTFAAESTAPNSGTPVTQSATQQQELAPYDLSADKMMKDNLLILGMLFFIFYFILIRPQQRRLKMHREMIKSLQKGSKIITSGGLIGTIVKFEGDDVVVLEIAPNIKVRISRSSVSDVVTNTAIAQDNANDN